MTVRDEAFPATAISGGGFDVAAGCAILEFRGEGGPLKVALPVSELTALLSVCIGLVGQDLPHSGEAEHATIPVADWRVGVSELQALILGLAPAAGGALAFHMSVAQAEDLAAALLQGAAMARGRSRSGSKQRH